MHIIVCVLLVILILLQSGKEGMGVIFGGGNSSVFGSAGAGGILAKLTAFMAVIFIITSLSYTYVTSSRTTSESAILKVRIEEEPPVQTESPAAVQQRPDADPSQPNHAPAAEQKPAESAPVSSAPESSGSNNGEGQPATD